MRSAAVPAIPKYTHDLICIAMACRTRGISTMFGHYGLRNQSHNLLATCKQRYAPVRKTCGTRKGSHVPRERLETIFRRWMALTDAYARQLERALAENEGCRRELEALAQGAQKLGDRLGGSHPAPP
ncbi:hypothetical protein [Variovorax paradoxus]|uniref:hypothetical protein n=1 Tax=Variovorax paradoxus TaxID=34073 RepID=UPI00277EF021|nr:hypothetical protein [Variovorax paradoxus]MDP9927842.1 hypothetical protein [Variovorax paradoxus]